jgi:triphosphatase
MPEHGGNIGRETELAFAVAAERVERIVEQLERAGASAQDLETHYVDTPERHLAHAGVALRLRRSSKGWEQTLKASPNGRFDRLEETVSLAHDGDAPPPADPGLHRGSEGESILRVALETSDPSQLAISHATRVQRLSGVLEVDGTCVEVAFDRGEVVAGDRSAPICELELELVSGDARALVELARRTIEEHGVWLLSESKGERGDRLRHGDSVAGSRAVKSKQPALKASMDAHRRLQAIVASVATPMLANAGALAAGDRSDEVVHQLRVSIRRFRTVSRELGWMSPTFERRWEDPLADVFRVLGAWRDRDSVAAGLATPLADAGSPAPVLRPTSGPAGDPVDLARSEAFQTALMDVLAFTLPSAAPEGEPTVQEAERRLRKRLTKLHGELEVAAGYFAEIDEVARHRVRKRLKRLRYLAEAIAPLHSRRRVDRYLARLEPAQDALGEHMDLVVALGMAEQAVGSGQSEAWFNVGWVRANLPSTVKRCQKALGKASGASPFWT